MSDRTYGSEEKAKLQRLVDEGVTVLQEIEDLQAGLKDTVKSVAEELDMKPALINKAIKVAKKQSVAYYAPIRNNFVVKKEHI